MADRRHGRDQFYFIVRYRNFSNFSSKMYCAYCAFFDASEAFDKILHNGLLSKLLKRGAPEIFTQLYFTTK